jgi:hypothetical protein
MKKQRSDYFDKPGIVSIWLGSSVPEQVETLDILRDLCGVQKYEVDSQEVNIIGDFEEASVGPRDSLRSLGGRAV